MPTGTVSFLFTDIEGSTLRWETYGDAMRTAVARHDELMRAVVARCNGHVFKTVGDAVCAAFFTTSDAVWAAYEAQRTLATQDWTAVDGLRVRMGVHVGAVESRDGDYFGRPLNRLAHLLSCAYGGQIVVTEAASQLVEGALPEGTRLESLGTHRLRDLSRAELVYALAAPDLATNFPPLRSLDAHPNNLPVALTSFVGRERDLEELREPFARSPLLTLTGTGGVGKTRMALALAADALDRFAEGVWLIDLSPIVSGDAVADEVATVLAVQVNAKEPVAASIVRALRDRRMLLIFDNCEQVIAAAAQIVSTILGACPQVRIVATSREPLRIPGEHVHAIGVLDVPAEVTSAAEALRSSAVRLFVDRAHDVSARFALTDANAAAVVDICRRVDGIALAIELAAGKTGVLSPQQLSDRLGERFRVLAGGSRTALPRQQTLRALIDWSYDLLADDERRVFRRLAAFAGSFTLDAVDAVSVDDQTDEWRVFDILAELVTKSLVVADLAGDVPRYRLLESMRDYARDRLRSEDDERAVLLAHARYYAVLSRRNDSDDDAEWARRVMPEVDNIRAALDAAFAAGGDVDTGLSLLAHLESAALIVTPQEAARWFAQGCAAVTDACNPALVAQILTRYSYSEWSIGTPIDRRLATAHEAVAAATASQVDALIVDARTRLGATLCDAGRYDEAETAFREADTRATTCGDAVVSRLARSWGINELQRGDLTSARRRFTADASLQPEGSEGRASALLNLGEVEFASGDLEAALSSAREAKRIFTTLRAPWLALVECNLAGYALAADRLDEAAHALRDALALLRTSGAGWLPAALEHCALLAALHRDDERAARLLGYTREHYRMTGKERPSTEQRGHDRLWALLNERVSADSLAELCAVGARLSEGEAVALAIAADERLGFSAS
jgi:predicted ATPase/class 3 adenylate cyclase